MAEAFIVGENGYPVPTVTPTYPSDAVSIPYPDSMWRINSGVRSGYPYNDLQPDQIESPMVYPYPDLLWRIEKGYNEGYPFHLFLIGIPFHNPWVEISQGEATIVDDTTSIEYKRYSKSGYTNPDLIRFQDKEFEEGDIQKIGIYGLNSYRYIETQNYTEGSTEVEIP